MPDTLAQGRDPLETVDLTEGNGGEPGPGEADEEDVPGRSSSDAAARDGQEELDAAGTKRVRRDDVGVERRSVPAGERRGDREADQGMLGGEYCDGEGEVAFEPLPSLHVAMFSYAQVRFASLRCCEGVFSLSCMCCIPPETCVFIETGV